MNVSTPVRKGLTVLVIGSALILSAALARRGNAGVEVQLQPIGPHTIRSSILASGKITYDAKASLTAEIIGIVKAVRVREGDTVHRGQLVLEIRDEEYVSAVEQADAAVRVNQAAVERSRLNVQRLKQQVDRNSRLLEARMIPRDTFDQININYQMADVEVRSAVAALEQARAEAAQARQRLSKTRIYSPIDGIVTSLDIKVGETAIPSVGGIPGSTLMTIADPGSLYTEVHVDEADIGSIKPGAEAQVVAVAFPDTPLAGRLESMATAARVAEGRQGLSFAVKIRLAHTAQVMVRPGMSCRAEISTRSVNDVLAVPLEAIITEEDRIANRTNHFVFVSRDNVAERRAVTVGAADDSYQEIRSGLRAGELIVVGPDKVLQNLKAGDGLRSRSAQDVRTAGLTR